MGTKTVVIRKEAQTPSYIAVWHGPSATRTPISCRWRSWPSLSSKGESSRLYRRLVREEELAIDVGGGIPETIDPHLFHDRRQAPARAPTSTASTGSSRRSWPRSGTDGITPREYDKALNIVRSDFYRGLQTISGKADQLGAGRARRRRLRPALHHHGRLRGRQDRTGPEAARKVLRRKQQDRRQCSSPREARMSRLDRTVLAGPSSWPLDRRRAAPGGGPPAARAGEDRPQERPHRLSPQERRRPARQRPRSFFGGAGIGLRPGRGRGRGRPGRGPVDEGRRRDGRRRPGRSPRLHGGLASFGAAEEYAQLSGDTLAEHFPRLLEIAAACLTHPAFAAGSSRRSGPCGSTASSRPKTIRARPSAIISRRPISGPIPWAIWPPGRKTRSQDDRPDGQGLLPRGDSGPTGPSRPSSATSTRPSSWPLLERTLGRMANPSGPGARGGISPPCPGPRADEAPARR